MASVSIEEDDEDDEEAGAWENFLQEPRSECMKPSLLDAGMDPLLPDPLLVRHSVHRAFRTPGRLPSG